MNPDLIAALWNPTPKERELLRLYSSGNGSSQEISDWFTGLDFEALYSETAWLAARVCAENQFTGAPELLIPRLKGILKYVHTLNSGELSALHYLGCLLRQQEIPILLLRETAICARYPNINVGHLWMAEAAVGHTAFSRILEIAAQAGFSASCANGCGVICRGNAQKITLYTLEDAAFDALESDASSMENPVFLIPKGERIFLSIAEAFVDILKQNPKSGRRIARLVQLWHLQQKGLDMELLARLAEQENRASQLRLVLEFMESLFPGTFPPEIRMSFGSRERADALGEAILSWQKLPPRGQRWKRMWLRVRMQTADKPRMFPFAFVMELFQAAKRKLHRFLT